MTTTEKTNPLKEEYRKWRDDLSTHLKKLRDILTLAGMTSDEIDETISEFLENVTTEIGDLSTNINTWLEEHVEEEEGEGESLF